MRAQPALGLKLSWLRVTVVFLVDVTILVLAGRWPGDAQTAVYVWWSGVGVAALVAILALVSYHRVPLSTVLAVRIADQFADPERKLAEGRTDAVDHHRRYGRESVGVREYQDRLVAVIEIGGRPAAPAGRHHRGTAPMVALAVEPIAAALRQFDVWLEGIDIVSVARRDIGDGEDAAVDQSEVDEEYAAPEHRDTWLVLRMDPQRNAAAVAARDSLAGTLAAATERLAHDLEGRHIIAHVVTAEEFADVDTAILADLQPPEIRARLGRLKERSGTGQITSFWLSPHDITTENLEHLFQPVVAATVVTVRLTRRYGEVEVSALVRYHSGGPLHRNVRAALNRLTGRQLSAVRASLPVPTRRSALVVPARRLPDGEQLAMSLGPVEEQPVVRVGAQP